MAALVVCATVGLWFVGAMAARAAATQEPTTPSATLEIVEVRVTPGAPSKDQPADTPTLHRLEVTLANQSPEAISRLRFEVEINGQPATIYERRVYLSTIQSKHSRTVRLYNFWAPTEALRVTVRLTDARTVTDEGSPGEPAYRDIGVVAGLPLEKTFPANPPE